LTPVTAWHEIAPGESECQTSSNKLEIVMAESVYKVIELVGTSTESWEKAAKAAVDRAAKSLRDLRVAEVVEQDLQLKDGKVEAYRAKVKLSFKYEGGG
jgi:flavin-binding protein dodecin